MFYGDYKFRIALFYVYSTESEKYSEHVINLTGQLFWSSSFTLSFLSIAKYFHIFQNYWEIVARGFLKCFAIWILFAYVPFSIIFYTPYKLTLIFLAY